MSIDIKDLESKIKYYAQKYYEGTPEISDEKFDQLIEMLKSRNPESILLKTPGWGYNPDEVSGTKVNHKYGVISSINRKPRTISEVPNYLAGRISAKLDGLSGVAYFTRGRLERCLTRGNGIVGIDKTSKMIHILNRSKKWLNIPTTFTGAIRGEFVISIENWNKLVSLKPELADKSPRNYAAGIINRNEIDDELQYIDFVAYKIVALEEGYISDVKEADICLNSWFDNVVDYVRFNESNKDDLINQEYLERLYKTFNSKYPSDGCVITSNQLSYNKSNKEVIYDEVAYKFNGELATSQVEYIDWNRTRTGKLTPTIVYKPVVLDGATLRRCAGFNAKFIIDHKIKKGTLIKIHRSGMVIPDLAEVLVDGKWIKV